MHMHMTPSNGYKALLFAALLGACLASCGGDASPEAGLKAPTNVKVTSVAGPAAHLTWDDTANEENFVVERKTGGADFAEVDKREFNQTTYHDADVTVGMTYSYRVAATSKKDGKSPYSAPVTLTVEKVD
jgi:fibronectin type 3 domain-containing protein